MAVVLSKDDKLRSHVISTLPTPMKRTVIKKEVERRAEVSQPSPTPTVRKLPPVITPIKKDVAEKVIGDLPIVPKTKVEIRRKVFAPKPESMVKPKDVFAHQYFFEEHQRISQAKSKLQTEMADIEGTGWYTYTDKFGQKTKVRGWKLKEMYKEAIEELVPYELESQKLWQKSISQWHPETKIETSVTDKGIESQIIFPYTGAEHFHWYKEKLKDPVLAFATGFAPAAFMHVPTAVEAAQGNISKAFDKQVESLAQFHTFQKEGALGFLKFYASSPMGVLATSYMGGFGITAGVKYIGSMVAARYGAGSLAAWGVGAVQAGVGGAAIGYSAADIQAGFKKSTSEGWSRISKLGIATIGGYGGYRLGKTGTIRGATAARWGFQKGFEKRILKGMTKGDIDLVTGARVLKASRLELQLRRGLRDVKIRDRKTPEFGKIQTLKDQPEYSSYLQKQIFRKKAGIFGSVSEEEATFHDIDVMFKNVVKARLEAQYAAKRFGAGDFSQYADIKPWQRVGTQVGRAGTIKQPWVTVKGWKLMRISESAQRHGESAWELPHIGRTKDITRSVRLYTKLFKAAGEPSYLKSTLDEYSFTMSQLEKSPFIMKELESQFIYGGKPLSEYWSGFKTKVYTKFAPKSWLETSFTKTMGTKIPITKPLKVTVPTDKGLPPTPSPSYGYFVGYPSASAALSSSVSLSSSMSNFMKSISKSHSITHKPSFVSLKRKYSISPSVGASRSMSSMKYNIDKIIKKSISSSPPSPSIVPSSVGYYPSSISSITSSIISTVPHSIIGLGLPKLYGRGRLYYGRDYWGKRYRLRKFHVPTIEAVLKRVKI